MGLGTPNTDNVLATSNVTWVLEKLAPYRGIPQTRVTWSISVNIGGNIPKSITNKSGVKVLNKLVELRQLFNRDADIDSGSRRDFVEEAKTVLPEQYSVEENQLIAEGNDALNEFEATANRRNLNVTGKVSASEASAKKSRAA
jgi:hypothetical protein